MQLLFQISYGITEKLRILAVCDSESMLKSNCLHFFTHTKQMFGSLRIQGSKTCCLRLHLLSFSLTSHSFRFLLILPLFLVSNYIASSFQVFEYLPQHYSTLEMEKIKIYCPNSWKSRCVISWLLCPLIRIFFVLYLDFDSKI